MAALCSPSEESLFFSFFPSYILCLYVNKKKVKYIKKKKKKSKKEKENNVGQVK